MLVGVTDGELRLDRIAGGWALAGAEVDRFALVNDYLSYLSDRNYSPQTVHVYGFSLLAFCRWLTNEEIDLAAVNTVRLDGRRIDGYAPATVNSRQAPVLGLFEFRAMRDPRGREARRLSSGERNGLLPPVARRPRHDQR